MFYFTHLLSVPFYGLMLVHGSSFWKWLLLPGGMFVIEAGVRLFQVYSERGRTSVVAVEELPSQVRNYEINS